MQIIQTNHKTWFPELRIQQKLKTFSFMTSLTEVLKSPDFFTIYYLLQNLS